MAPHREQRPTLTPWQQPPAQPLPSACPWACSNLEVPLCWPVQTWSAPLVLQKSEISATLTLGLQVPGLRAWELSGQAHPSAGEAGVQKLQMGIRGSVALPCSPKTRKQQHPCTGHPDGLGSLQAHTTLCSHTHTHTRALTHICTSMRAHGALGASVPSRKWPRLTGPSVGRLEPLPAAPPGQHVLQGDLRRAPHSGAA